MRSLAVDVQIEKDGAEYDVFNIHFPSVTGFQLMD